MRHPAPPTILPKKKYYLPDSFRKVGIGWGCVVCREKAFVFEAGVELGEFCMGGAGCEATVSDVTDTSQTH